MLNKAEIITKKLNKKNKKHRRWLITLKILKNHLW